MAIALFGQLHDAWLLTFLDLPNGIPSHNTLGRDFARLDATGVEGVSGLGVGRLRTDRQAGRAHRRPAHARATTPITWRSPAHPPQPFAAGPLSKEGIANQRLAAGLELGQSAPAGRDQAHTAKMQSLWKGTPVNRNILSVWVQADCRLELPLEASEGNSFNETALGKEEGQENRQSNQ